MPRDVLDSIKVPSYDISKNPKDISCKPSHLSFFRLWIFNPNSPFKSTAITDMDPKEVIPFIFCFSNHDFWIPHPLGPFIAKIDNF